MSRLKLFRNSKGDTIVEVLISIAVLSLVLSVSYALSNRNTAYIRQSQERGEAQKISERQLELLRAYTEAQDWNPTSFDCFNDAGQPSDTECNSVQGIYDIRIAPDPDDSNTYTVTATWPPLTGDIPQNLQLSYKLPDAEFEADQFDPNPDSYIEVAVNRVPRLPTTTSNPTPPCSNPATQPVVGATTTLTYSGLGAPPQSQNTGANGKVVFDNLVRYGTYSASLGVPSGHQLCPGPNTADFFPGINPTINIKVRPVCNYQQIGTNTYPVYASYWVQDVPIWGNVEVWGWGYQDWFWWSYWPPGYGSVNPPYNTVFESGGNRLELRQIRTGHHNANYRYDHYTWRVVGYNWQVVGWGWREVVYIHHWQTDPVFGWVCP